MLNDHQRILIIDDEEENRFYFSSILSGAGYECLMAENGTEGHEMYEKERPAVILLDINMPGISGMVALRKIRATGQSYGLDPKVVMLTARAEKEFVTEALGNGAAGYLLKTVTPEKLVETVKTQLA
ncbi:MAG: response regulator [bacterium]|nr:response regulator [bacterium]